MHLYIINSINVEQTGNKTIYNNSITQLESHITLYNKQYHLKSNGKRKENMNKLTLLTFIPLVPKIGWEKFG